MRKFIQIPMQTWQLYDLTPNERVTLALIENLQGDEGCFASNDYFAQLLNVSTRTVTKIIAKLVEKEHIKVLEGRTRLLATWNQPSREGRTRVLGRVEPEFHHIRKSKRKLKIDTINRMNGIVKGPTVEMVTEQMLKLRASKYSHINIAEDKVKGWAEAFVKHYDDKQWETDSGPIMRWWRVADHWYKRGLSELPKGPQRRVQNAAEDLRFYEMRVNSYTKQRDKYKKDGDVRWESCEEKRVECTSKVESLRNMLGHATSTDT